MSYPPTEDEDGDDNAPDVDDDGYHDNDDLDLEDACGGTRWLNCFCGGDFCACGEEGADCPGCEDCDDDGTGDEGLELEDVL